MAGSRERTSSPTVIPFTEGEERELRQMVNIGPQNTFGKGRVAVQNRLVRKGMAEYVRVPDGGDYCRATPKGRAWMKERDR